MYYIGELREGENVSEVYLCKNKIVAKTKANKTYYSMQLQDKTGTIDAKIWELSNAIEHFEPMDYIRVDGQITSFNNALQLNVKRVRVAKEGEYDPREYMPCSSKDVDVMYSELTDIIERTKNMHLNKLLKSFFIEDASFKKRFIAHSAAKSVHHGFMGGLLEHTLSVAKSCEYFASQYPILKRDLLVTAALFHDIGKLDELSTFPENDYTDEGQLLGHIVIGTITLSKKMDSMEGFPETLKKELLHCIVSHHGELEFGSPKKPALIEALVLSHADNLDAKVQTFAEAIESGAEGSTWLGFNRLLDSNIRPTSNQADEK